MAGVQASEKRHIKPVSTSQSPDAFVKLAATSFRSQTYLFSDDRLKTSTDFLIIPFNYTEEPQLTWKWNNRTAQADTNDHNCDPRVTTRPLLPAHVLFFRPQLFRLGDFLFTCRNIRVLLFAVLNNFCILWWHCKYTNISMKKVYSFCLMVEASDHGYVLHTRRIHVTRYRIRYDMI
jgi:hypothetical protein